MNIKKQPLFALAAAFIWGTAFVAQSVGAESVKPLTFNTARSLVATAVLLIINFFLSVYRKKKNIKPEKTDKRKLVCGGILCGLFLTLATALQQTSLADTSAGKAGFITALYIVIVPICGIFIGRKAPAAVWCGVLSAVVGLYFLCIKQGFSVASSDILLVGSAFMFAVQILLIDRYVQTVDAVLLSLVEFAASTVFSGIGMLIFEKIDFAAISGAVVPILYLGIFSSGIAYTLQMLAQKDSDPTVISLILSLESVFGVIAGAVLLGDRMSAREYIGCFFMMLAVVFAQLPRSGSKAESE